MTTLELEFGQLAMLLGLSVLTFYYLFKYRIWSDFFPVCDSLFLTALLLVVASIAQPLLYGRLATEVINQSPLPAALTAADERVLQIERLPSRLIQSALAKVGYESDSPEADGPLEPPEPGPFSAGIRPSVEAILTGVLRGAGFVCGTLLLWTTLALRALSTRRIRLAAVSARVDALEHAAALSPLA
ncbi:MAG: hypothetical protein AB8G23_01025 [Myxococcota bacterium]